MEQLFSRALVLFDPMERLFEQVEPMDVRVNQGFGSRGELYDRAGQLFGPRKQLENPFLELFGAVPPSPPTESSSLICYPLAHGMDHHGTLRRR